ncbi:MAG: hypothetical protein ACPGTU_06695 [Myxococcota bacterium]
MSPKQSINWKRRIGIGVPLFVVMAFLVIRQIEVPHPWVYGPKAGAEHIMKANPSRRWVVAHSYGALAAQWLSFAEIRIRGNEIPLGLEAAFYDGAAHHQDGDFEHLDAWLKEINSHVPDVQRKFFYDGIMRLYVHDHGDSPEKVMEFASELADKTNTTDLSNGVRIGLQQRFGDNIPKAIQVASDYPEKMHGQLYEELGWRVGNDEGFSATDWQKYQDGIPEPSRCDFAEGIVRGATIIALGNNSPWWPKLKKLRSGIPPSCSNNIYSGIAEALLIVHGDNQHTLMEEAKNIALPQDFQSVAALLKKKQGNANPRDFLTPPDQIPK